MEWNLKLIYKTEDEFEKDFLSLDDDLKKIEEFKGKLNNKESVKEYTIIENELERKLEKVYSYAHMNHDLNQKDLNSGKRFQKVYSKYMEIISRTSFVNPELLKNKYEDVMSWCNDPVLKNSKYSFERLFRGNKYVKNSKIEEIMSRYNEVSSGYSRLYDDLLVADGKSVDVELSDGTSINVDSANYTYYLATLEKQDDRRRVFEAYYKKYDDNKNTLASIYKGVIAGEYANMKNRGYKSILESHLFDNNIDKKVYTSLISVAKNNNQPVKRYYNLKKKYLGLKNLYTYDRMIHLAESKMEYTYEESKRLVLEADKELGADFYDKAVKVMEDGRVSVMPKDGKTTGAYSTSTYQDGSFILLNHTNDLNSAFTLAHEAGHSIHSLYANETQPYETHDYTIFVAEVASTFNEARFLDYMMEKTTDKNERIVLLQNGIEGLIATFYRQTLFADYELEAHTIYENGGVIDEEVLSNIMKKLYKKYYGYDLDKEELKRYVWAYIPHMFHTPFYVYQYATSYSASQAIYLNVKNKVPGAFDKYINLLKSGGSNYPVELLKEAGVDLTTKEPFMAVVERLDSLVSQLEEELNK